jgi:hypothetical protein
MRLCKLAVTTKKKPEYRQAIKYYLTWLPYLAMVRSQLLLEHCSTVWSPSSSTSIDKSENLQKRAIKWVFDEQYSSYSPEL